MDANQAEIVAALRQAGAKVKVIHQPYDLQIWSPAGKSMFVEVKNPATAYGKRGLNDKQTEEAQGMPVSTVDGVEAALRAYKVLCHE